jgi:hypothetical protein
MAYRLLPTPRDEDRIRSRVPGHAARWLAALLLTGLVTAASGGDSMLPPSCQQLLDEGEFSSRFRVIDPLARVTACRMKGEIAEDEFDLLVKGRVEQWTRRCFSDREQAYLHGVLRQATLQSMPFVTRENCASNLEQLLTLPEPWKRP